MFGTTTMDIMCEEEETLPPHLLFSVLEKCSIRTILCLSGTAREIYDLCQRKNLMAAKLLEVLQLMGRVPDKNFLEKLRSKNYTNDDWKKVFEHLSPYIRWNSTPIFVDKTVAINNKIDRVILAREGLMRIEVPGGFITYHSGEEIFTTPVQTLLGKDNIHYTENHMVARIPGQQQWNLVEYSVNAQNNMSVISELVNLNQTTNSKNMIDVVSHTQQLAALYSDRLIVYDWIEDRITTSVPHDGTMVKIIPEFSDDGRIYRAILKDHSKRNYKIIDFFKRTIVNMYVYKSCVSIVPIFDRDLIWAVDSEGIQTSFSMITGKKISSISKRFDQGIIQAIYLESVKRIVIVNDSGKAEVGEITDAGFYNKCGTLEYGVNKPFAITELVTGPTGIALVGDGIVRYISFQLFSNDEQL